jgi:hypothetical protein
MLSVRLAFRRRLRTAANRQGFGWRRSRRRSRHRSVEREIPSARTASWIVKRSLATISIVSQEPHCLNVTRASLSYLSHYSVRQVLLRPADTEAA